MRTLYLCYFGLREPLVQTQVLPYLRQIREAGIEVALLTFEPNRRDSWTAEEREEWRRRLMGDGIDWYSLAYHRRPSLPATLYDVIAGGRLATKLIREQGIQVLHARSHVPLAISQLASARSRCRTIFDFRGLMAEEYADAGVWREGSLKYRAVKSLERLGFRKADQVVVLTKRMREWLITHKLAEAEKVEVIPCCVDPSRFSEENSEDSGALKRRFEIIYAGSVTGLYLLEEMARFFLELRAQRAEAFFRILTNSPAQDAAARLVGAGLNRDDFEVGSAQPADMSRYLRRARLGISFRKSTFSQIAASPTKLPEYLAAGLPIVCNAGVGDMDRLLGEANVGVIIKSFERSAYADAAKAALALADDPDVKSRCARLVGEHFDLRLKGGPGYLRIYQRLQGQLASAEIDHAESR